MQLTKMINRLAIILVFLLVAFAPVSYAETFKLLCANGGTTGGNHNGTWNQLNTPAGASGTWKQIGGCGIPYPIYPLISAWGYTTPVAGSFVVQSGCAMGWGDPNASLLGNALWATPLRIGACFNGPGNIWWQLSLTGTTTLSWYQPLPAVFTGQSVTVGSGSTFTFAPTTGLSAVYGTIIYTAGSTLSWSGNTLSASGPGGSGSLTFWQ